MRNHMHQTLFVAVVLMTVITPIAIAKSATDPAGHPIHPMCAESHSNVCLLGDEIEVMIWNDTDGEYENGRQLTFNSAVFHFGDNVSPDHDRLHVNVKVTDSTGITPYYRTYVGSATSDNMTVTFKSMYTGDTYVVDYDTDYTGGASTDELIGSK